MNITLIIILVILLGGAITAIRVRNYIRRVSKAVFGTTDLLKALEDQNDRLEITPKSLSGMTKIYLPQIQKDFPEFNWPEFRTKAENQIKAAMQAISTEDLQYMREASEDLKQQLKLKIEDNKNQRIREQYQNVKLHQTVISRYEKKDGLCIIYMQTSYQSFHYKTDADGNLIEGSKDRLEQSICKAELLYVQDEMKVKNAGKLIGLNCPNCGAPITNLGSKFCEYCKSAVSEINIKAWSLNKIIL